MEIILVIYGIGCFFIALLGCINAVGGSATDGLSYDESDKLFTICLIFFPGYILGYLLGMLITFIIALIAKDF